MPFHSSVSFLLPNHQSAALLSPASYCTAPPITNSNIYFNRKVKHGGLDRSSERLQLITFISRVWPLFFINCLLLPKISPWPKRFVFFFPSSITRTKIPEHGKESRVLKRKCFLKVAFGEELDVAPVQAMFDMLGGAWHKQFSPLNRENRQPEK